MMGVLWYYRLEHTETAGVLLPPRYVSNEVFASRHRDVVPVACIEDRCFVLTLNQFNRCVGSAPLPSCSLAPHHVVFLTFLHALRVC